MEGIKLEAGKYYRTHGGDKVFIAGKSPFEKRPFEFCGFVENQGTQSWTAEGKFFTGKNSSAYDIVAEWKEPKRVKGWLAIGVGYADAKIEDTREEALKAFGGDAVACIEIDVLEGQGLDGSAR